MTSKLPDRIATSAIAARTVLCSPASSMKFIDRARELPVDMVILDLEDSVTPEAKTLARQNAVNALQVGGWAGRRRAIRINAVDSPWFRQDLSAIAACANDVDEIVVPKVHAGEELNSVLTDIDRTRADLGLPTAKPGLHVQIEDALGLLRVEETAAHPAVTALSFGPADFVASLHLRVDAPGQQPAGYHADAYHYPMMRILTAARAFDLAAYDGPYLDIADDDGFQRSCNASAGLGFDGKWVLHPNQVATATTAFEPSAAELAHAKAVIAALTAARHSNDGRGGTGRGAATVNGKMVDEASRRDAERVLARTAW